MGVCPAPTAWSWHSEPAGRNIPPQGAAASKAAQKLSGSASCVRGAPREGAESGRWIVTSPGRGRPSQSRAEPFEPRPGGVGPDGGGSEACATCVVGTPRVSRRTQSPHPISRVGGPPGNGGPHEHNDPGGRCGPCPPPCVLLEVEREGGGLGAQGTLLPFFIPSPREPGPGLELGLRTTDGLVSSLALVVGGRAGGVWSC
ncbi:hypothetical protein NDU88_001412 [Pleurodeles waltl]|uniref:Uncharacterized protein n=1 Tax=Pleurodeles waltl TaxID=8319 RepID=A0AAV7NAN6_PLEWA|nr:hypothetical protein NDU88_001412 [Pleurodeles waltl]